VELLAFAAIIAKNIKILFWIEPAVCHPHSPWLWCTAVWMHNVYRGTYFNFPGSYSDSPCCSIGLHPSMYNSAPHSCHKYV
jgi:hypothetical protein